MTNPWTTEEVEILTDAWRRGLSAGQIEKLVNRGRNSILGKLHRLNAKNGQKLRRRATPKRIAKPKPKAVPKKKPAQKAVRRPVTPKSHPPELLPKTPEQAAVWLPLPDAGVPATMSERTGCHWPVDTPGGLRYCNEPIERVEVGTKVYCATHRLVAYPAEREKAEA